MSYQVHPEAETEHLETVAYYEDRQPGLGASYLTEFESALEHICEAPHRYPMAIEGSTPRFTAKVLVGHHADFWADVKPHLTVLSVDDFMAEADRVERELFVEGRMELERIRAWVRRGGLPVVGYQLEGAAKR